MRERFIAAALPALLLTAPVTASDDDPARVACWQGDLAACEAGVAANSGDFAWLAQAVSAYRNAGDLDRAAELGRELTTATGRVLRLHDAARQLAQQELADGDPLLAVAAYTFLAGEGDSVATITHLNQTGGSPFPPDDFVREAMAQAEGELLQEAMEGRGLAWILAGNADAGLADLRAALEHGRLGAVLRVLRERGIDYQGENRFTVAAIDAELEALLRGLAQEASAAGAAAEPAIAVVAADEAVLADGYRMQVLSAAQMEIVDPEAHAAVVAQDVDLTGRMAVHFGSAVRSALGRVTLPDLSGDAGRAVAAEVARAMGTEWQRFGVGRATFEVVLLSMAQPEAEPVRIAAE